MPYHKNTLTQRFSDKRHESLIKLFGTDHANLSLGADAAAKEHTDIVNAFFPARWIVLHSRLHEATPDDFVLRPCGVYRH